MNLDMIRVMCPLSFQFSMEECEALCDRISIMVKGQFRCLGGPQHLKNKFGQGFTIIVKLLRTHPAVINGSGIAALKAHMASRFAGCEVKDDHKDYIHFHVADPHTPWHALFETMQLAKEAHPYIQDYSLTETSLEDVFLLFARGNLENAVENGVQEGYVMAGKAVGGQVNEGLVDG